MTLINSKIHDRFHNKLIRLIQILNQINNGGVFFERTNFERPGSELEFAVHSQLQNIIENNDKYNTSFS
jgi:hypothetical protein